MGELGNAREHYQAALAIDPTNRIAERNINRLRILLAEAGKKTVPAKPGSKAPVSIFVEETGKTGFAHLRRPRQPARPGAGQPGRRGGAACRTARASRPSPTAWPSVSWSRASRPAC